MPPENQLQAILIRLLNICLVSKRTLVSLRITHNLKFAIKYYVGNITEMNS